MKLRDQFRPPTDTPTANIFDGIPRTMFDGIPRTMFDGLPPFFPEHLTEPPSRRSWPGWDDAPEGWDETGADTGATSRSRMAPRTPAEGP